MLNICSSPLAAVFVFAAFSITPKVSVDWKQSTTSDRKVSCRTKPKFTLLLLLGPATRHNGILPTTAQLKHVCKAVGPVSPSAVVSVRRAGNMFIPTGIFTFEENMAGKSISAKCFHRFLMSGQFILR
jgi:hypothetical protein